MNASSKTATGVFQSQRSTELQMATAVCGSASSFLAARAIQSHTHREARRCCLVQPQVLRVFWPVSEVAQLAEEESRRARTDLLLLVQQLKAWEQRVFWPVSEVVQTAEEESHRARTDLLLLLKADEQLHDELLSGRKRAVRLESRGEGVALVASALFAIGG